MSEPEVNLTEEEKKIFEAIDKNDTELLKALLTNRKSVNILDENAMTPLQHAAYKGNKEMVQALLDQGADVNLCKHQHEYTALHFAGLSGNVETCLALLQAGAKSDVKNTVGRTPSQMAAFVGHHNCVVTINNFVPKSEIEIYTTSQGNKPPQLPPFLEESFLKFIMQVNIHPVKVVLNLQNFVGLSEHLSEIQKVLQLMRDKEMKRNQENNETLAFKFHYLSYIVGEIIKIKQRQSTGKPEDDKKLDVTELFTRKILKPGLDFMDGFIKECIREFPFRESTLFRQMVASLAGNDPPSALSVLISGVNGQRGFIDNTLICNTCGEDKPAKKCSKCKVVQYCDRNCQRLHWHWHKKACSKMSQLVIEKEKVKVDPSELELDKIFLGER